MSAPEIDVLVQVVRPAGMSCRGWSGLSLDRPVRILVLGGDAGLDPDAEALGLALAAGIISVTDRAVEEAPLCGGRRPDLHCTTERQPEVRQVLAYVGDTDRVDAGRERVVDEWMYAGGDAVAVLRVGVNPDRALPAGIRDLHAAFWHVGLDEAVIDVLAVAGVVTADQRMFISYSHADGSDLAHAVFDAVTAAGFDAFLDVAALVPGTAFAERIEHRLADAAFVVVVETPESVRSAWVGRELAFARRRRAGIAAIGCDGAPRALGVLHPRRIRLQPSELIGDRFAEGAARRVVHTLRAIHAQTLATRRAVLERSLRSELEARGVRQADITRGVMLRVRAGGDYAVALLPRPAGLKEMHRAFARTKAPVGRSS